MVAITSIETPKGVEYDDSPQKSPRWLEIRAGRIGASELSRWMATSVKGLPLQARKDLELEKAFEKAFNVPFSRFVTGAMQQGIDNENFVRDQYSSAQGVVVRRAGAFYDKYSVASPDGLIGDDGGLEIKWLQDNSFTKVVASGEPLADHVYQIQGNLRLSGRKWWDYVAANGNTGRFIVIRVKRNEELIKRIDKAVKEVKDIEPLKPDNVFAFTAGVPVSVMDNEEKIWS